MGLRVMWWLRTGASHHLLHVYIHTYINMNMYIYIYKFICIYICICTIYIRDLHISDSCAACLVCLAFRAVLFRVQSFRVSGSRLSCVKPWLRILDLRCETEFGVQGLD